MQKLSGGIELAGAEKALAAAKKEFVVLQGQANENEMLLKRLAEFVAAKADIVAAKPFVSPLKISLLRPTISLVPNTLIFLSQKPVVLPT
jgi:hypothetical protein